VDNRGAPAALYNARIRDGASAEAFDGAALMVINLRKAMP
jgi:hypothetical protein